MTDNPHQPVVLFTEEIDKYFAYWIRQDTWSTDNITDEENFHRFVKALVSNNHTFNNLQENIMKAITQMHGIPEEQALIDATKFSTKALQYKSKCSPSDNSFYMKHIDDLNLSTCDQWKKLKS